MCVCVYVKALLQVHAWVMNKILAHHNQVPLMHSLQTRRNKQIKMKWTWKKMAKKKWEWAREGRRGGGREGVFRIVIGAVEVISVLKSSRCEPAPEKENESERNQERGRSIYLNVPFQMISRLPSHSEIIWFESGKWIFAIRRLGQRDRRLQQKRGRVVLVKETFRVWGVRW